jgi:hypothetical protein
MASLGEEFELGEVLLILGAIAGGIYLLYKGAGAVSCWFKGATCIAKVGTIPGVTGATAAQAQAPQIAAGNLKAGGSTIWSCGSDYDYAQPCGDVVQVRHSFWGQLFGTPVTYTTVPRDCYVRPAGGTVNPAFACCYACAVPASAAGNPPCNGGGPGAGIF